MSLLASVFFTFIASMLGLGENIEELPLDIRSVRRGSFDFGKFQSAGLRVLKLFCIAS